MTTADAPDPLHDAVQAVIRSARVLERSLEALSLADFRVLSGVAEGAARASRLADRLALGRPAISASVDSLIRRGMLIREQEPGDGRAARLSLTTLGRQRYEAARTALGGALDPVLARTTRPDEVLAALVELGRAVERMQAERMPVAR